MCHMCCSFHACYRLHVDINAGFLCGAELTHEAGASVTQGDARFHEHPKRGEAAELLNAVHPLALISSLYLGIK